MGLEEGALAAAIVGALGSLAGTGVSMAGAAKTQSAENDVAQNQLNQQEAFAKKGQQIFQSNVDQQPVAQANANIKTGAGNALSQYLAAQQGGPQTAAPTSVAGDPLAAARTQQVVGQGDEAASQLQGFSNMDLQRYLGNQQTNRDLSVLGAESSFAGGTLGPMMQTASTTGAPLQAAGSGISALSNLAALYGMYNYGKQPASTGVGPGVGGYSGINTMSNSSGTMPFSTFSNLLN